MAFEPVLHSVSYAGVWPGQARLSLNDFLQKAASLGFPAVMLMAKRPHLSVLDFPRDACLRLRERMDQLGVQCRVIAGYNNFTADLEHPDIPLREMQIQHIAELCRMASDLGASVVRIFTGYEHAGASYASLHAGIAETLRECAVRAAGFGVTLGVQNHHDFACHYLALRDLLETVNHPNCRACFDAWAPALQDGREVEAAHAMAAWTCHTTAADYVKRPRYLYQPRLVNYEPQTAWVQAVPFGEGFINYSGFLSALREGGYKGAVAYEMCSPLLGGGSVENLDRHARHFLERLAEM